MPISCGTGRRAARRRWWPPRCGGRDSASAVPRRSRPRTSGSSRRCASTPLPWSARVAAQLGMGARAAPCPRIGSACVTRCCRARPGGHRHTSRPATRSGRPRRGRPAPRSASSSRTNSSAGTVATTGSALGGRPSTRTAVPTRVKSMLFATASGMVRILTSSTALAPAARASSRRRLQREMPALADAPRSRSGCNAASNSPTPRRSAAAHGCARSGVRPASTSPSRAAGPPASPPAAPPSPPAPAQAPGSRRCRHAAAGSPLAGPATPDPPPGTGRTDPSQRAMKSTSDRLSASASALAARVSSANRANHSPGSTRRVLSAMPRTTNAMLARSRPWLSSSR